MKSILNCISKLTLKVKLETPIIFEMNKSKFILKINNKILEKDISENNFNNYVKSTLPFKLKNKDVKSQLEFSIKHNNSKKYVIAYNITNPFIVENIDVLEKITNIHLKNYTSKKSIYISSVKDVAYVVLNHHQNEIISLDYYREMKTDDVVTEEVLNKIKYL